MGPRFLRPTALSALLLLGAALAEAKTIATGPVRAVPGDDVHCFAINVADFGGTVVKELNVEVSLVNAGSQRLGGQTHFCRDIDPGDGCSAGGAFAGQFAAYCRVSFGAGKVRATLCNQTRALCADAQ